MNDLRPSTPRVLAGTELGSWQETVFGTVYRSNNGWLICRARGKGNKGRITGTRFYVFARDGMGRPHKIRNGASVRYFDSVWAAASAAYKYSIEQQKKWASQKLVSDLHALELQKKQLLLEIEGLSTKASALRKYGNSLNSHKTRLLDTIKNLPASQPKAPGMENRDELPDGFLSRVSKIATHVVKHRYFH